MIKGTRCGFEQRLRLARVNLPLRSPPGLSRKVVGHNDDAAGQVFEYLLYLSKCRHLDLPNLHLPTFKGNCDDEVYGNNDYS